MITLKALSYDKPAEQIYEGGWGYHNLYPKGTRRVALAYFIFSTTLNGERRRGIQLVEQEATINLTTDGLSTVHYNHWKSKRFIPDKNLEALVVQ